MFEDLYRDIQKFVHSQDEFEKKENDDYTTESGHSNGKPFQIPINTLMEDLTHNPYFQQAAAQHEEKIRRKQLYDGVDYDTFMHSQESGTRLPKLDGQNITHDTFTSVIFRAALNLENHTYPLFKSKIVTNSKEDALYISVIYYGIVYVIEVKELFQQHGSSEYDDYKISIYAAYQFKKLEGTPITFGSTSNPLVLAVFIKLLYDCRREECEAALSQSMLLGLFGRGSKKNNRLWQKMAIFKNRCIGCHSQFQGYMDRGQSGWHQPCRCVMDSTLIVCMLHALSVARTIINGRLCRYWIRSGDTGKVFFGLKEVDCDMPSSKRDFVLSVREKLPLDCKKMYPLEDDSDYDEDVSSYDDDGFSDTASQDNNDGDDDDDVSST